VANRWAFSPGSANASRRRTALQRASGQPEQIGDVPLSEEVGDRRRCTVPDTQLREAPQGRSVRTRASVCRSSPRRAAGDRPAFWSPKWSLGRNIALTGDFGVSARGAETQRIYCWGTWTRTKNNGRSSGARLLHSAWAGNRVFPRFSWVQCTGRHGRARAESGTREGFLVLFLVQPAGSGRSDRSTDYLTFAVWFATAQDDSERHALARSAFGLNARRPSPPTPRRGSPGMTTRCWSERPGPMPHRWPYRV
jgi:hypothetical protein